MIINCIRLDPCITEAILPFAKKDSCEYLIPLPLGVHEEDLLGFLTPTLLINDRGFIFCICSAKGKKSPFMNKTVISLKKFIMLSGKMKVNKPEKNMFPVEIK